jgi:hypothetical protein
MGNGEGTIRLYALKTLDQAYGSPFREGLALCR